MIHSLMEKYRLGMITDNHLVVECLHRVDPGNPGLVLSGLPDDILDRIVQFSKEYLHGGVVTNYGIVPAHDQVVAASHWIENFLLQQANRTG